MFCLIIHLIVQAVSSIYNHIDLKIDIVGKKIYVFHDDALSTCSKSGTYVNPNNVYINGKRVAVSPYYDFNQTNNTIRLVYNYDYYISSLDCLFANCSNITEVDLSNVTTSQIYSMKNTFQGCTSLISVNLSKFTTWAISESSKIEKFFLGCSNLEYIDLKYSGLYNYFFTNNLAYLTSEKLTFCGRNYDVLKNSFCSAVLICNNSNGIYENNYCYQRCANLTDYYNNNNICEKCGLNYHRIKTENDYINNTANIYCSYKEKNDQTESTENIVETIENSFPELFNCTDCDEKFNNNSYSKDSFLTKKGEFVKIDFDEFNNKTQLLEHIINLIFNELDISEVIKGTDLEIDTENNFMVTLTTPLNQRNNLIQNKNKTTIDLGECESKLILGNKLPKNSTLYIIKIDVEEKGMKIPKIVYNVYYFLNESEVIKLNLKECENTKIDISLPIEIDDKIEKHNSSSDYYNNVCSKSESNKGTDISLSQRKNLFVENNMTLCEEDCDLTEYNETTKKVKCSCLVKISFPLIEDIKFDKDKLFKSFTEISNIANVKFMKCFKNVYNPKNLKANLGFYIFIILLIMHFISLFLFCFKYYSNLINEIQSIIDAKTNMFNVMQKKEKEKRKKKKNKRIKKTQIDIDNDEIMFPPIKKKRKKRNDVDSNLNLKDKKDQIPLETKKRVSKLKIKNDDNNNIKENAIYKKYMEYNDSELNSLEYEKALISDKRTFVQYYISLLRINHLLFFSFYCKTKDYNSQIIKMFLFFFYFSVHLTVNALFFTDGTMLTIYNDEGHFNFIYQISQIIYSSLISVIINILVKFLALTEKSVLVIKREKEVNDLDTKFKELVKTLKIKFTLFFILTFVLLLAFMHYITCFCGIYSNTQLHLITDSIISFGLDFIYPFGKYLLPAMFRILALRDDKKDRSCIYKFSLLIQNI